MGRLRVFAITGAAILALLATLLISSHKLTLTVSRQITSQQSFVRLSPGTHLTQHFFAENAPSALMIPVLPSSQPSTSDIDIRLLGPKGSIVQTWRISGQTVTGPSTMLPVKTSRLESGEYILQMTLAPHHIMINGWAVDRHAGSGTGVDRVLVFLDGLPGHGVYLGPANYGLDRPNVATALGSFQFEYSGWQLEWNIAGIKRGPHTLYVFAHSAVTHAWSGAARPVRIDVSIGGRKSPTTVLPPPIQPVVLGGVIEVVTDTPAVGDIYRGPQPVDISAGGNTGSPVDFLKPGRLSSRELALTIRSRVSMGAYLGHLPFLLAGGRHGFPEGLEFDTRQSLPGSLLPVLVILWLGIVTGSSVVFVRALSTKP